MVRYTTKARRVVFYACEQALHEISKEVTPEHLLVGLLRADQSLAARFGLPTIALVHNELTKTPHERRLETGLALSDAATRVISLAAEEREHLFHKHIGTEHLLLGIIRGGSDAARVLERRGLTIDRVRDLVSQQSLAVEWEKAGPRFGFDRTIDEIRPFHSQPLPSAIE
jgi:ATP-dependent Clp protease ATP-binding subunit ClpC